MGLSSSDEYGCGIGLGRSQAVRPAPGPLEDQGFGYLTRELDLRGSDSGSGLGYLGPFGLRLVRSLIEAALRPHPWAEVYREFQYLNPAMLQRIYVNQWCERQNCTHQGQLSLQEIVLNAWVILQREHGHIK